MSTDLTKNTFSSTYKDDFLDSDNYHRILFNSGRALQARELTQLQTITQSEISRMNMFNAILSVSKHLQDEMLAFEKRHWVC